MSDSRHPEVDLVGFALAEAIAETADATLKQVENQTGVPAWARVRVFTRSDGDKTERSGKPLLWTIAEDRFLEKSLGRLSEEAIAAQLGRTPVAVHLRWSRDLRLPAPSKTPGYVTAARAARMLGVDVKAVVRWIDELEILSGETLPFKTPRRVRRIRLATLKRFATRPRHWVYFNPLKIPDPELGRLVARAHELWGDEWLSTGQVAAMHNVDTRDVTRFIYAGKLSGVRWYNWRVKRSDAERVSFPRGRGSGHGYDWPAEADAFLVLARAVGLSTNSIACLVHWPAGRAWYRLDQLHRGGHIPEIIGREGFQVEYDPETGNLWADWQTYRQRFPSLARAMDRLAAGKLPRRRGGFFLVKGAMRSWSTRHLGAVHPLTIELNTPGCPFSAYWVEMYRRLVAAGMPK